MMVHPITRAIIDSLNQKSKEFYGEEVVPTLLCPYVSTAAVRYTGNSLLVAIVSLINEMANICEKLSNVNVTKVAMSAGVDKRADSN